MSAFALTVHNCTNDDILCRYMKNGQIGTGEVNIGPRASKLLTDAYAGMVLYASNSFDPSAAYAQLQINQHVDEVHFTESAGGYGRGAPVGPPQRVSGMDKPRRQKPDATPSPPAQSTIPGDGADNHGVSLTMAHAADLTQQGHGGGGGFADGGAGGDAPAAGGSDMVYVPGLGYMNPSAIPPHVLKQLEDRELRQQQIGMEQQVQPGAQFPDYDAQQKALHLDGLGRLPPVRLHRPRRRGLTLPEQWIAGKLHQYVRWEPDRCEKYARPICLGILGVAVFIGVSWYRQRQRKHKLLHQSP